MPFAFRYSPSAPEAAGEELVRCEGSWVGFLDFAGRRYWDIRSTQKMECLTPASVLPSDSRLRPDRVALQEGNVQLAQNEKVCACVRALACRCRHLSTDALTIHPCVCAYMRRCGSRSSSAWNGASARRCTANTRSETHPVWLLLLRRIGSAG